MLNGWVETKTYCDDGYSGGNFERPAVQELLGKVQAGEINCILVKDFSRFGRNSIEVGYFMEMVFPLYGVRFISVNDDFDTNRLHGDTGGLSAAFRYLASEFFSRDLSEKYKSAKRVKFKRGEYQSKVCPYGYRKGADGRMEPDEETAPNVQLIFELAEKGYNAAEIVQALFERNVPTPGEYKAENGFHAHDTSRCCRIWQRSTVLRILSDERYTGTYVIGKREVTEIGSQRVRMKDESEWVKIPGHHPAIVSKELFQQVQGRLRHFKSVKKNVHLYPLRGKVFCGCCHHALTRTNTKGPVFLCRYTHVDPSAACHGMKILESELEEMLCTILSKQAQVILNIDSVAEAGTLDIQLAKQAEYAAKVEAYMEHKRELYERFVLRELDAERYKAEKDRMDIDLNRLRQLHSALAVQTAQAQFDERSKNIRKQLAQEISGAGCLTTELAEALIERVYVYPENQVQIVWKIKEFCPD